MTQAEDLFLTDLIRLLIDHKVEMVIDGFERVKVRKYDSSLNLGDVDIDLVNWIIGE